MTQWPPLFGSSPHTRGTHDQGLRRQKEGRFIPAYAGNAPCHLPGSGGRSVHPRIRGERLAAYGRDRRRNGSSPHTRGTQLPPTRPLPVGRFIPAYAGNAPPSLCSARATPVHPRIRGERLNQEAIDGIGDGSSPHTRGTLGKTGRPVPWDRFIPAYAGNAHGSPAPMPAAPVHPRIRGERMR